MSKKNSQDDQLCDSAGLLKAVRESETELPGVGRYLATLDQAYARAVKTRGRRDSLVASAQKATGELNEELKALREAGSSMRNFIKSVYGWYSEKLLRFGIKPIRRRARPRGVWVS